MALIIALLWASNSLSYAASNCDCSGTKNVDYKSDEVLIKFNRYAKPERLQQIQNQIGLLILNHFPKFDVYHMRITDSTMSLGETIERLQSLPEVVYAEPNYLYCAETFPSDPSFSSLWGLHNTGQIGGTADADIDAPEAWDINTGSSSIVVAVIDTGIDYNHVDLSGNMWKNASELLGLAGVDDDNNGYIDDIYGIDAFNNDGDPYDDNGHGTHCAGTIGAKGNNGIGVVGANWNVQIMALKFLSASGVGPTSDALECLQYVITMKSGHGVNLKLTSNSWGGGSYSEALKDAIEATGSEGMLFVAAAGNNGALDNDITPHYPSGYELANIIAVAATDYNDDIPSWSHYGSQSVDLAAPGDDILSTIPGDSYGFASGTSMATPHVSGTAALLWAHNPSLPYLPVKETILSSVDHLANLDGFVLTGGRLNAFKSVTCDPGIVKLFSSLSQGFTKERGIQTIITAHLEACEWLKGAMVTAAFSNGDPTITFTDDGVSPDKVAGDGLYTGSWTPDALGLTTVTFTALHNGSTYIKTVSGDVVEFMGYHYDDSVPFGWIDISGTGTPLNLPDDDRAYLSIPFPVSFYDISYSSIGVGSNGHILFLDADSAYTNSCIPSDVSYCDTFIASFWDDLNPSAGGQVYWQVLGTAPQRMLVVQYQDVPHYSNIGAITFQMILHEDSPDILMQYLDVSFEFAGLDFGASATVGLQRDAQYGQQYSCMEPVISNGSSILWFRPADSLCPGQKGDINDDGLINSGDAVLALRIAVGLDIGIPPHPADGCELCRCDVNCDGAQNSGDAVLILREAAGMNPDICPMDC